MFLFTLYVFSFMELDDESKIIFLNQWWLKKYVPGCLLGWMDGMFAAKNIFL